MFTQPNPQRLSERKADPGGNIRQPVVIAELVVDTESTLHSAQTAGKRVLMDAEIPELDGLEATRFIRISDTIDQPSIIAMTANAMPGDRESCLDAGMNDFIAKPVRLKDLQGALSRARSSLDASRYQEPGAA